MATAKWSAPVVRTSNFAGTSLNSLANGSESSRVTYDNSGASARDLYALMTIKLGSITPSAGGSITLRVTLSDGTDVADAGAGGDLYVIPLSDGASVKTAIVPVRLYPFPMRFSIINNSGTALAASGNEIYATDYNEDVT